MTGNPDRNSGQVNKTLGKEFMKKLQTMKIDLVHSQESNTQNIKLLVKWMLSKFYKFLTNQLLKKVLILLQFEPHLNKKYVFITNTFLPPENPAYSQVLNILSWV